MNPEESIMIHKPRWPKHLYGELQWERWCGFSRFLWWRFTYDQRIRPCIWYLRPSWILNTHYLLINSHYYLLQGVIAHCQAPKTSTTITMYDIYSCHFCMGDSIVVFPSMIDFSDSQLVLFMAYVFHPLLLQIKAYYRVKFCLALFFFRKPKWAGAEPRFSSWSCQERAYSLSSWDPLLPHANFDIMHAMYNSTNYKGIDTDTQNSYCRTSLAVWH